MCVGFALDQMLKVFDEDITPQQINAFDEDITPQQINALSDTKAIKELALIMTQVEESDDDEEEEEEE